MRLTVLVPLVGLVISPAFAQGQDIDHDTGAVREVIEHAYVMGIFSNRDPAAVRAGFHPSFVMSVLDGDSTIVAPLEVWLGRLQLNGEPSSDSVKHVFERVDVTANTAVAKLQLWINGHHTYTDYLGLYRFTDGWKIVTKVFASHD